MKHFSHIRLGIALLGAFLSSVSSFSIQTRRSTLYSNDGAHILGTILERKTEDTHEAWIGDHDDMYKVTLPFVETPESVGSTLCTSALVGAILLHGAPQLTDGKEVLELGSGLGLGGLVAGRNAARCVMTDSHEDLVKLLQEHLKKEDTDHLKASKLDWRDSDPSTTTQEDDTDDKFDVCLGLDVAYYYPLIAPLVNTVRAKRKPESLMLMVGQANREAQWMLYHHIRDGGYNQITDETEEPWEGSTQMILYKLEMGVWKDDDEEGNGTLVIDGVLPIAAILHTTEDLPIDSITDHDHIATKEDEEAQMMTF